MRKKKGINVILGIIFDMSKTYDKIEWVPIDYIIHELGFNDKFYNLIK